VEVVAVVAEAELNTAQSLVDEDSEDLALLSLKAA
jgi:hypothetical protein